MRCALAFGRAEESFFRFFPASELAGYCHLPCGDWSTAGALIPFAEQKERI
jgi:hypothetical protein